MTELLQKARAASHRLNLLSSEQIDAVLRALAEATLQNAAHILEANAKDMALMDNANPLYDRLLLTLERIAAIAADIGNLAQLPSPVHKVLTETVRPNGMRIRKVSAPFGVVGVIYEARPNVTWDVFALCFKTANACVLKGSSHAQHSNLAIVELIRQVLQAHQIDLCSVVLLPPERAATEVLLSATNSVDIVIPRGSAALINYVKEHSKVPVIETGAGVCHIYADASADIEIAQSIVANAKTRRVSVCNAAECLLVHSHCLPHLPKICAGLAAQNVLLYADESAYAALQAGYPQHLLQPAQETHFGYEFLDYKMAIKTVNNIHAAIDFIASHGTQHSECIVSTNPQNISLFQQNVDAACVYANVSTAFSDGAQFGLGAEIGISTQKLHARGPMGLAELCTYKWLIDGQGQVRA
ncbi:gamma-glutamyl phosphate reductase [Bacteroidia bacterium]|nr:gamma-glutamyl phosphate reductase [Bacteroidia bacterium]